MYYDALELLTRAETQQMYMVQDFNPLEAADIALSFLQEAEQLLVQMSSVSKSFQGRDSKRAADMFFECRGQCETLKTQVTTAKDIILHKNDELKLKNAL